MNQVLNANGFVELDEREAMDVDGGIITGIAPSLYNRGKKNSIRKNLIFGVSVL